MDNYCIRTATDSGTDSGYIDIVRLLLQDGRSDPSYYNNSAIRWSSKYGNTEMVKLLLQDKRVDPSDDNRGYSNPAIRVAYESGHMGIVKLLLQDKRVRKELTPEEIEKYNKVIVNHKP